MTLTPFLEAPLVLQIHIIAALPAILIGPFVLFRRRVDVWHKRLGYVWMGAMVLLGFGGLFIPSSFGFGGHFGPLHILSVITLGSVYLGIHYARIGNIAAHEATLRGLWIGGIGVTMLLQFLPGRTVHEMVFGTVTDAGYVVIALGAVLLGWVILSQRPRASSPQVATVSRSA